MNTVDSERPSALRRALDCLRRDESGAVHVLGILCGAVLFGAMWNLVSVGSAIVWRERAQDIADATAFENALWHARGMNLMVVVNLLACIVMSLLVVWRMILLAMLALAIPTFGATLSIANWMVAQDDRVSQTVHDVAGAAPYLHQVVAVATPFVAELQTSILIRQRYAERGRLENVFSISSSLFPTALVASLGDSVSVGSTDVSGANRSGRVQAAAYGDSSGALAAGGADETDDTGEGSSATGDGFGIGLPGQKDPWQTLCGQAGEAAGVLITDSLPDIPGIGGISDRLVQWGFAEATDAASDPFCQDWEGFQRLAFGLSKKGCKLFGPFGFGVSALCKKAVKKALKAYLGGDSERNDGNADELATIGPPPYFENGGDAAQTWSFIQLRRAALGRADAGLEIIDGERTGNLNPLPGQRFLDWTMAGAEFYSDCEDDWRACAEDSMWRLAWRTRLRRFRHPLGLLHGAAALLAGKAEDYLTGLEDELQDQIHGWVRQIAAQAIPEMGELTRFFERQMDERLPELLEQQVDVSRYVDLSGAARDLVGQLEELPDVLVH